MRWVMSLGVAATVVVGATLATSHTTIPASAPAPASAVGHGGAQVPSAEESGIVSVMSRNLYLGADVGVALDLLPDLSAAAQFMWDQVTATDFGARAPLLADEANQYRPAVIGLQEATRWLCTDSILTSPVPVYDFTQQFLAATAEAGTPYVIASRDGRSALNPGYRIGPLPGLTVTDPSTFQPIFGKDSANCGFEIGDALLVRADLAEDVVRAGTSEYEAREVIVPTVLAIDRGFAWADVVVAGTTVRFVTTHLESLWEAGRTTTASVQARQLVADLHHTNGPLIVMGDFNSDPRDPRPEGAANPASQPEASDACHAQVDQPNVDTARSECSPYWIMRQAGYTSAGPPDSDPAAYTYGASVLLAGPDPDRIEPALAMGNRYGFTDRLDYIFVRNGVTPDSAEAIGSVWPYGPRTWTCDDPAQVANTQAAGELTAANGAEPPPPGAGVCLPSDHAGVVATVVVDPAGSVADDAPPVEHDPFRLVWWHILLAITLALAALIWWRVRARRRRKRRAAEPSGGT